MDSLNRHSWITNEIEEQMCKRDKIVTDEDFEGLFLLEDNSDFSIALFEILSNKYERKLVTLNQVQNNLFLSMNLENASQADSILGFLQEMFPNEKEQVIDSLKEIGAVRSSDIIKEAVALLPSNDRWFFEVADKESQQRMKRFDSEFSNYPDGSMRDLYRLYAEKYRIELQNSNSI